MVPPATTWHGFACLYSNRKCASYQVICLPFCLPIIVYDRSVIQNGLSHLSPAAYNACTHTCTRTHTHACTHVYTGLMLRQVTAIRLYNIIHNCMVYLQLHTNSHIKAKECRQFVWYCVLYFMEMFYHSSVTGSNKYFIPGVIIHRQFAGISWAQQYLTFNHADELSY